MKKEMTMPPMSRARIAWLVSEVIVYALFIFTYYFLVLHFLGGSLKQLFDDNKALYAIAALGLISAQGILLEWLTAWLFAIIRGKAK